MQTAFYSEKMTWFVRIVDADVTQVVVQRSEHNPAIVSLAKHYFAALHLKQKTFSFYKLK